MTLETIKSTLIKATPFLDGVGVAKLGRPYIYLARPALTALHGFFETANDTANIAYNALAYPVGYFLTTKGPIAKGIEKASQLVEQSTNCVTGKIFSSPFPKSAISILANSYAKLRMSLYLRKVIPFMIAGLGGASIYREPRTALSGWEIGFWLLEVISLIAAAFENIQANQKLPSEEKLAAALLAAIDNGDQDLANALTEVIKKRDDASIKALVELIQKRSEGQPKNPPQEVVPTPATAPSPENTSSDQTKQDRILELASNLRKLREERNALPTKP